jgi:hypothetical protein
MKHFLNFAILCLLIVAFSCDRWEPILEDDAFLIPPDPQKVITSDNPLVQIITNEQDSLSQEITKQIATSLNYAKIPYATQNSEKENLSIPTTVETIVLTYPTAGKVDSVMAEKLVRFAGSGHSVIVTTPTIDISLYFLTGIDPASTFNTDTTARGIAPRKNIFPGYPRKGYNFGSSTSHGGMTDTVFKADVEVLATAVSDTTYPVLLKNRVGNGNVFLYNTYSTGSKQMRGLLFSNLIRTLQGIPYNVANTGTIFLDDFPEAVFQDTIPPIAQEYNISSAEFVKRVWWPDMKGLADSLNFNYTALLTNNYNGVVIPPFNFSDWTTTKLKINGRATKVSPWMAKDVLQSTHELGFHGYNHTSLVSEEWPRSTFMGKAVNAAQERWQIDNLGPLPVSYVPPHNYIDSTGLAALAENMPSIQYISSTYLGETARGGNREFSLDPYLPTFFNYPRTSDGYYSTGQSLYNQHSVELMTGIWTHFIHPDDVYDIPGDTRNRYGFEPRNRKALGWRSSDSLSYGLYDLFVERLEYTHKQYPLLKLKTVKNAVPDVLSWRTRRIEYETGKNSIKVKIRNPIEGQGPTDWYTYIPKEKSADFEQLISEQADTVARSKIWNGYLYQFRTHRNDLTFPKINQEQEQETGTQTLIISRLMKAYNKQPEVTDEVGYTEKDLKQLEKKLRSPDKNPESTLNKYVDAAISLGQVPKAITPLQKNIIRAQNASDMTLVRLLTFLGWRGESAQIWDILDQRWDSYPDSTTLNLKDEVVARQGWPDTMTQQKWQQRGLAVRPNNSELLRSVITQNSGAESWPLVKRAITKLISQNPASDTLYALAVQRSLFNEEADSTLEWIEQFPPHAAPQLKPFADDVAWLYADRQDFVRAKVWAERAAFLDPESQLYWLSANQRYHAFANESEQYLQRHPQDDSLRVYAGNILLGAGFQQKAYPLIYPLFAQQSATDELQNSIQGHVQGLSWQQQKKLYKQWPAFFSQPMINRMDSTSVWDESFVITPTVSITSDNFNNEVARAGLNASWGYSPRYRNIIKTEEVRIQSPAGNQINIEYLHHLGYEYEHRFNTGSNIIRGGVGALYSNQYRQAFVNAILGYSRAADRSYFSTQLKYQPVLTTSAVANDINQVELSFYREDRLFNNHFRTALSGMGRAYTDNVQFIESSIKGYIPVSLGLFEVNPVGQFSFSTATKAIPSGIPYWTPDQLRIYGAGLQLRDTEPSSAFDFSIEAMRKYNSNTGYYNVFQGSMSYRINHHIQLQVNGRLSTSQTYRSNTLGLSLTFNIPGTAPKFRYNEPKADKNSYGPIRHGLNYPDDSSSKTVTDTTLLIGQVERSPAGGSLDNLPISITNLENSRQYRTRTHYNGEFYYELPSGHYSVTVDTAFVEKSEHISPGKQEIELPKKQTAAVEDTVRFVIEGENIPTNTESSRFFVQIEETDTLSAALNKTKKYQSKISEPVRLHFHEQDSSFLISSALFTERKTAAEHQVTWEKNYNMVTTLSETTDPYPIPVRFYVQYASFENKAYANSFLEYVRNIFPDIDPHIRIDPIRGVYQVLSKPFQEIQEARQHVNASQAKKYLEESFLQFDPERIKQ